MESVTRISQNSTGQGGLQAKTPANQTEKQKLEESKDGNSSDTKESKKNNDPTELNTRIMMAYHNGAWTCPTPFYMDDWTHRDKYHVCNKAMTRYPTFLT
jgi:hypothetical protein